MRLYFNQIWGSVRTESRSYTAEDAVVLLAGTDDKALLPLFGFQLPAESYAIAEWEGAKTRVFPPPAAKVERSHEGDSFCALCQDDWQTDGQRRFIVLEQGQTLRMLEGDQILTVTLDDQKERAGWDKQKAAFWLVFLVIVTLAAPLMFLLSGPDPTLVFRAMEQARERAGLPAKHEPIDISVPDEGDPAGEVHRTGVVLPASVR